MSAPVSAAGGFTLALGAAAAYGFNITFARIAAGEGVQGPVLVTYRVIVMLMVSVALGLALRESLRVDRRYWSSLLVLGLTSAGVGVCYLSSVAFIPVTVAAVLFYTYPVIIVLVSPLVERGRLSPGLLGVACLAFLGVVLVLGPAFDSLDPRGVALALGASASAVIQFFVAARCGPVPTAPKILWVHVVCLPAAMLAAVATGGMRGPEVLLAAPWAVTLTIGGFVLGFVLQMAALGRVGAVAGGLAFCLEPVVAAGTSALVLGERLAPVHYAGGLLVVLAIMINVAASHRRSRRVATA
jgi:drug/metabolite transporter (DMT)-like permease